MVKSENENCLDVQRSCLPWATLWGCGGWKIFMTGKHRAAMWIAAMLEGREDFTSLME